MFEQSVLVAQPTNKSLSFLVSLTLECLLVALALLLPLMYTNALPRVQWVSTIAPPRPAPAPVAVANRSSGSNRPSTVSPRVFTAPAKVPDKIAMVDDAMPAPSPLGVPGSVGDVQGSEGVVDSVLSALRRPPAPPVEVVKPRPTAPSKPVPL